MPDKEALLRNLNERTFNPMNDVAFKFIFGNEERKSITIGFLDDILCDRLEHHIKDITYRNSELPPLTEDGKLSRLDVRCRLDTDEEVDVEMQVINYHNMQRRTLFYWARMFIDSLGQGLDYIELKPSITINILAFDLLPQADPLAMYTVMNPKTGEELSKDLTLFFIEIPKYARQPKKPVSQLSRMERWMAYFANQLDDKERTELAMSDTAINNAMDAAKTFLSNDDDRLKYLNRQMAIMDYNSAIRGAREDGFTDGEASGKARGMDQLSQLMEILLTSGKNDDAIRVAKDEVYRDKLLREYHIN